MENYIKILTWSEDETTIEDRAKHVHGDKLILLSDNGIYGLYVRT